MQIDTSISTDAPYARKKLLDELQVLRILGPHS